MNGNLPACLSKYVVWVKRDNMKEFSNYNLKERNTFGIDVTCRRFVEFGTVDELLDILHSFTADDKPLFVMGGGSNVLFTKDYGGTILHSAIKGHHVERVDGSVFFRCGSGEIWDDVVRLCVANGLYGAENLSLIPGEVGASAVQNIGAYGIEAKDLIFKVEAVDIRTGEMREFMNGDCGYSYRWSRFKGEWKDRYVITHVTYKLSDTFVPHLDYGNVRAELEKKGINTPTAAQLRNTIIEIRKEKLPDPAVEGNAGSFFTNPIVEKGKYESLVREFGDVPHYAVDADHVKIPAGWMIEQCGWKGKSLGKAGVHSRQALVIVNHGGATGDDILGLCWAVRADVMAKFGVEINPEVNII